MYLLIALFMLLGAIFTFVNYLHLIKKNHHFVLSMFLTLGCIILSFVFELLSINSWVTTNDWSALLDTTAIASTILYSYSAIIIIINAIILKMYIHKIRY